MNEEAIIEVLLKLVIEKIREAKKLHDQQGHDNIKLDKLLVESMNIIGYIL